MINRVVLKIPKESVVSKYASRWQRVRLKLKAQLFLKKLGKDEVIDNRPLVCSTRDEEIEEEDEDYLIRRYSVLISNKLIETLKLEDTPFLVLHPESRFKRYWNIVMALSLLYTAVIMPFVMAFIETQSYDVWFFISLVLDILFMIDFILNCITAYYNNEGTLITSRKEIIKSYIKGWFFIDITASFPFNIIELAVSSSTQTSKSLLRVIKVPRIYRLLRISKLFKVASQPRYGLLEKVRDYLNLKHSSMKLITSTLIIIICVHISSCFWYYIARMYDFDDSTWVYNLGFLDSTKDVLYITCIYWAVTTMTTVGYGDIHPYNNTEKIFSIIWMSIGIFFISFSIGRLASVINTTESKDNLLLHKLAAIEEFCSEAKISKSLQTKLRRALKFSTDKQGGSWGQKEVILGELPRSLKYELALNMFQGAAKKIEFFKNHEPALVAAIVPLLQPIFANKDEFVYKEGEIADEIYFMTKGRVSYCFGSDNSSVAWVHKGNYFGDIEVVMNCPRIYNALSVQHCELFILNRDLIETTIETFPLVWEEICNEALMREKLYEKAKVKLKELHKLKANGKLRSINYNEFKKIVEAKCKARQDDMKKSEAQVIKDLVLKLDKLIIDCSKTQQMSLIDFD